MHMFSIDIRIWIKLMSISWWFANRKSDGHNFTFVNYYISTTCFCKNLIGAVTCSDAWFDSQHQPLSKLEQWIEQNRIGLFYSLSPSSSVTLLIPYWRNHKRKSSHNFRSTCNKPRSMLGWLENQTPISWGSSLHVWHHGYGTFLSALTHVCCYDIPLNSIRSNSTKEYSKRLVSVITKQLISPLDDFKRSNT